MNTRVNTRVNTRLYDEFLSDSFVKYLQKQSQPVAGVPHLKQVGQAPSPISREALLFLCELYENTQTELRKILHQRRQDRQFIDQRTSAFQALNQKLQTHFQDPKYRTVLGEEDAQGRIVMGPLAPSFQGIRPEAPPIAPLPEHLKGYHVTLFGPPDDPKLSINAMNAFHRKLPNEPSIITKLLETSSTTPKWGADFEDSKTPLWKDFTRASHHLSQCLAGTFQFKDPQTKKTYRLEQSHLAQPIRRFPGLALPCPFLLYRDQPLPLHLYDFALHVFQHWHQPQALTFYVPKLENEEEARYIRFLFATAEKLIQKAHPHFISGTLRALVVLENPRALFRVHEIMDELHPYFAGASLGWHDFLSSTARIFKEDPSYRIPNKADPNIVINYIKASHELLAQTVGSRGGIQIGGMYGVLPNGNDLKSPSFQVAIQGFIKDVVVQLKRGLSGFWVAHPDFIRIGISLVEAWKAKNQEDPTLLEKIVIALLDEPFREEVLNFIHAPDVTGLDHQHPLYLRSLLAADLAPEASPNAAPEAIRYNVFQTLQYLADWLTGNGCVALPAHIRNTPVRIMDDLATTERSRWEVWHELHHGRFPYEEFLKIAHEELHSIRKIQIQWNTHTEKWYPIAFQIMLKLMTADTPPEFATELLLPFTLESVRNLADPWTFVQKMDPQKYALSPTLERFCTYFSICGCVSFAQTLARGPVLDLAQAEKLVKNFDLPSILEAASFHGDMGESKKTLDERAIQEQALVWQDTEPTQREIREKAEAYRKKFGLKFLISAQGKSSQEILQALSYRLEQTHEEEIHQAREELWEITRKRLEKTSGKALFDQIEKSRKKHLITEATLSISSSPTLWQTLTWSHPQALFEIASLSKTLAAAFAIEYFREAKIPLTTSVNFLFTKTQSPFRIPGPRADEVTLTHLLNHTALNMHYVNGFPLAEKMPTTEELLTHPGRFGYVPVQVNHPPGTVFQYSGGGFLVLEHLLEAREKKPIQELIQPFLTQLGLSHLSFVQKPLAHQIYAGPSTRKMHPALAAGGFGTSTDLLLFLQALTHAYHHTEGCGPISHDTAVLMLSGSDLGSGQFMNAKMGLGIFVAEAGPNRLAIHQGANEGFRCLYLYCYQGPDRGKGLVVLATGDTQAVIWISEVTQLLLQELSIQGIQYEKFKFSFLETQIPPEQRVNQGYKELIFQALVPDLPEPIERLGKKDPLAEFNRIAGAKILSVSNQRFARAENLISSELPIFDPHLFGRQGKVMDSWETARHNTHFDSLVLELLRPSPIGYVSISTQFHSGNHPEFFRLEGLTENSSHWLEMIPQIPLQGHSLKKVRNSDPHTVWKQVRVSIFPDGGLTRLGLYTEDLPQDEKSQFFPITQVTQAVDLPFSDPIPRSIRPLSPTFFVNLNEIQENWKKWHRGEIPYIDAASTAWGGKVLRVSNEHYGAAAQILSPIPPLHMFDGFESARSRAPDHFEEIVVELHEAVSIQAIAIDFQFFVNNNPSAIKIEGATESEKWVPLVPRTEVKAYAGNTIQFLIHPEGESWRWIRVLVFPDGGFHRLHIFCAHPKSQDPLLKKIPQLPHPLR